MIKIETNIFKRENKHSKVIKITLDSQLWIDLVNNTKLLIRIKSNMSQRFSSNKEKPRSLKENWKKWSNMNREWSKDCRTHINVRKAHYKNSMKSRVLPFLNRLSVSTTTNTWIRNKSSQMLRLKRMSTCNTSM